MALGWFNTSDLSGASWTCGYCGKDVGGNVGYQRNNSISDERRIYICPFCENPTAFVPDSYGSRAQFPRPVTGNDVGGLPKSVGELYGEVRRCMQCSSYTSAAMAMRKLLMHVAVDKGAEEGLAFAGYVRYLEDAGWVPPSGRDWVDRIRTVGNEATHEIAIVTRADAETLLDFTEMLLRIVYEFPARLGGS